MYSPTNTGYSTLRDFLIDEIFSKSDLSFCTFAAISFSDLPIVSDWGFIVRAYYVDGAMNVILYRFLSNADIYIRGTTYTGEWVDDWKQISFV